MAFNVGTVNVSKHTTTGHGGYGISKTDLTVSAAGKIINDYAQVTGMSGSTVTIGSRTSVDGSAFTKGREVLVHCVAYVGSAATCITRGKWQVCTITKVNGDTLTLNQSISSFYGRAAISELIVQLVSIPHYRNVTINSGGSITCTPFSDGTKYGGVVAFKCNDTLTFKGGHIDLGGKGIPTGNISTYWSKGFVPNEDPTSTAARISAGWENYRTTKHLTLNSPDGAAFIIAKNMQCHSNSRIGLTSGAGVARTRVNDGKNIGGSSILLTAENISDWNPALISKYPSTTNVNYRGQARCYIATETLIPTDEGLYALDKISDPTRMSRVFNLDDIQFGNGSAGKPADATKQLNSYYNVTKYNGACTKFIIDEAGAEANGIAKLKKDALILIHAATKKGGYKQFNGRCMFARVTKVDGNAVYIGEPGFFALTGAKVNIDKYDIQIIVVPEFSEFTLDGKNEATPKMENGRGGIAVLAVNGTCDLSNGKIFVYDKGNKGAPYGTTGLDYIGNSQMAEKLPLGEGNGSVLILAKKLIMSTSTRLGAGYTGNTLGGINYNTKLKAGNTVKTNSSGTTRTVAKNGDPWFATEQAWEGGQTARSPKEIEANCSGKYSTIYWAGQGRTGGGQKAADAQFASGDVTHHNYGGFGSNSTDGTSQGAHVLIIANEIQDFCIDAISTGGRGGESAPNASGCQTGSSKGGGASYGGSGATDTTGVFRGGNGGFIGGGSGVASLTKDIPGGGSGGFAFVYCNKFTQKKAGISLDT